MPGSIGILFALELGVTAFEIGLMTSLMMTVGLFVMIPFGILARGGRKKCY